jgi:hypothetical protein
MSFDKTFVKQFAVVIDESQFAEGVFAFSV